MKILEQEDLASRQKLPLLVQFTHVKEIKQDFIKVIPEICKEKHPILHKFISMTANHQDLS